MSLPDSLLDAIRHVSPRLQVMQCPTLQVADIPPHVWRNVEILHTNTVLPPPQLAPALRLVQLDTSGIDHIVSSDLWRSTDIPVATLRGVSSRWMAEYVVMMILAFSHGFPEMLRRQWEHDWPTLPERWRQFAPRPLVGAKVVVVGYGEIGRAIGEFCCALGMDVVGVRRRATDGRAPGYPDPARSTDRVQDESAVFPPGSVHVVPLTGLREALEGAGYVVVVLPLTRETQSLIDRDLLGVMNERTVLINVARGGIVDEEAVAEALRAGRLGGAAFDVFGTEPLPAESALWGTPNLLVSPHVAGFAGDYVPQIEKLVCENIRRLLHDEPLLNVADRAQGY